MQQHPLTPAILNALFYEPLPKAGDLIGAERLERIRIFFKLNDGAWLSSKAKAEFLARSPQGFALFKCWRTLSAPYDPKVDSRRLAKLTFEQLIEYRLTFAVLEVAEISLLCEIFGLGKVGSEAIPNRKIGAKHLAKILHEIKVQHEARVPA